MGTQAEVARPWRVVADTNVAVSALVFRGGRMAWLRDAWEAKWVTPVVSGDTLAEFVRVLTYPKFKLTEQDAKTIVAHYMDHAEAVARVGSPRIPPCRDPDDRMFLRLAYSAKVHALVTGDKDLLSVADRSRIPVMTPDALRIAMKL